MKGHASGGTPATELGHPDQPYDFQNLHFPDLWAGRDRTTAVERSVVALALRAAAGSRVLEVGPGGGRITSLLTTRYPRYVGVDVTPRFLRELSKGQSVSLPLVAGDAQRLPLVDASFDVVVMVRVFNFLVDPSRALREIHRVLAPGGVALLSYHPDRSIATVIDALQRRVRGPNSSSSGAAGASFRSSHLPSREGLTRALSDSGFEKMEEFATGLEDYSIARWLPVRCHLGLSELFVEPPIFPQRFVVARKR